MPKKHKKATVTQAQANRHPAQAICLPLANNTNFEIELNIPGDLWIVNWEMQELNAIHE